MDANPDNLTNEDKIELLRLLCKLNGADTDNMGCSATIRLAEMDLGPLDSGKLRHSSGGAWYYSDGSCYPNQAWAVANNWEY